VFDEEELEELDTKLEMDYHIGEDLKEKVSTIMDPLCSCQLIVYPYLPQVIPRAIDYFTGKALRYEIDDEDYSEEEDEDEDEEGDGQDEEDEDEEDEEEHVPRKGPKRGAPGAGSKRTKASGAGMGGEAGECKQQ